MYSAREGEYTKDLIPVTGDVFGIVDQLKSIDSKYFVMFNRTKQRFEIHHSGQRFQSFCLAVPYDELDARTLEFVKETRVENYKKLKARLDKENLKLEAEKARKFKDVSDFYADEVYDWANRHTDPNIPADANTTRWV
jgi:crotonobetainyl-CoA:carnitine CoA-transferase CaiB-like acyl-CoA transferase